MKMVKVLMVESDLVFAIKQEKRLKELGFDVVGIAPDYLAAMLLAKKHQPDVAICSYMLTVGNSLINVAEYLGQKHKDCVLAIYADDAEKKKINESGYYFLNKSLHENDLKSFVNYRLSFPIL